MIRESSDRRAIAAQERQAAVVPLRLETFFEGLQSPQRWYPACFEEYQTGECVQPKITRPFTNFGNASSMTKNRRRISNQIENLIIEYLFCHELFFLCNVSHKRHHNKTRRQWKEWTCRNFHILPDGKISSNLEHNFENMEYRLHRQRRVIQNDIKMKISRMHN